MFESMNSSSAFASQRPAARSYYYACEVGTG